MTPDEETRGDDIASLELALYAAGVEREHVDLEVLLDSLIADGWERW